MENQFYAVQVTLEDGTKLLSWRDKKHFYFGNNGKKFLKTPPPTLFNTRKEAKIALDEIPEGNKGANLKQFSTVIECMKHKIVKVTVSVI